MSILNIIYSDNNCIIRNLENFDLSQTLDCGQAFRWNKDENGYWSGIAKGTFLKAKQTDKELIFYNTDKNTFENVWKDYFDFGRDYSLPLVHTHRHNFLEAAAEFGKGIHILKQDPWEALCSFIISQNNNIPRIKGIVERLCSNFGDKCNGGYTFPSAKTLSRLTVNELSVLRSGFRAKYILDAAKKVANNTINLDEITNMPTNDARNELIKIYGVGAKVADCTLLFGMGHMDAFPKDVWINRAIEVLFNGELPEQNCEYAGIIQQYIFYYARETKLEI